MTISYILNTHPLHSWWNAIIFIVLDSSIFLSCMLWASGPEIKAILSLSYLFIMLAIEIAYFFFPISPWTSVYVLYLGAFPHVFVRLTYPLA